MKLWMNFVILVSYFTPSGVLAAHYFPTGGAVYDYMVELRSGLDEPVPHISSFKIRGSLHVQADHTHPSLQNAFLFWLANVKHEMYNGPDVFDDQVIQSELIPELSSAIQDPFVAIYDENNLLKGLKFQNTESGWSRNIKKAIAAALQIDFSTVNLTDDFHHGAFLTDESTIHGTCQISYDVHTINHKPFSESSSILVTKVYEPRKCNEFVQRAFSHSESFGCYIEQEEDLVTSTRKVFYLERSGASLLFKKLVSHEAFHYFPWMHRSEIHYVQTSQTLEFDKLLSKDIKFSKTDFFTIPVISDVSYEKTLTDSTVHSTENITMGRHKIHQSKLVSKIKKLVFEAADCIDMNNLDLSQPDFKRDQTVNRLLMSMSNLNLNSMEEVFNYIKDTKTTREESARKIFVEMIPHIGTTASCLFIRNIVTRHKYNVSDDVAITMLAKLPSYVRRPTEQLLLEMEELLQMNNVLNATVIQSKEIKKAAILSFASLIYKTFKLKSAQDPPLLEIYLQYINAYLLDNADASYEMKLVHIMALRNIQVGGIERFLVPIISGEIVVHERQEDVQLAASFAVAQAINHDKELVHNLFWPILADPTNSLQLRIVAYDMLMSQLPDVKRAMNIHWLMENEQNKHLYHYHFTTIKSLAHLTDPCLRPVTELARKIWRLTKDRNVRGYVSGSYVIDYVDLKYGYGETFKIALNVDDESGLPSMGIFEYYYSIGRRSSPVWGLYWKTNIFGPVLNSLKQIMINKKTIISAETIRKILRTTKGYEFSTLQTGYLEVCIISHGRIAQVLMIDIANLNEETLLSMVKNLLRHYTELERKSFEINWQGLSYQNLYEMSVSTDIGVPVFFYNRLPLLLSSRMKAEFSTSKSVFNLKFKTNNSISMSGSYEMVAYNPIADTYHSVQRLSSVNVVYPLEVEISYGQEGSNLHVRLLRSSDSKDKGIRVHFTSLVAIFGDESKMLNKYCPLCTHYKMVNEDSNYVVNYQNEFDLNDVGLKFSHSIFNCGSDGDAITMKEEWLRMLQSTDAEFGYDPIYKLAMIVSHKIFNDVSFPYAGTCGSLILISEDINVSHVDINFNWNFEHINEKINSNNTKHTERLYLHSTVNTILASNQTSIGFWSLNISSEDSKGMEIYFIRKIPKQKNLVVCIQTEKTNEKYTFNLGYSDLDQCNTEGSLINAIVKNKVVGEYKALRHEIKRLCSKDKHTPLTNKYTHYPTSSVRNCLFEAIENHSFKKYDIDVSYREIPEKVLSIIYFLDDTVRLIYLPSIKYLKNHTEIGNTKVSLIEFSGDRGMNVMITTPYLVYELHNLPLKYISSKEQSDKFHVPAYKICNIFPETILLDDNENSPTKLSNWTLISGDYQHFTYAILAKVIEDSAIAIKLYHGSHCLEIEPKDSSLKIMFNGIPVTVYENEIVLPSSAKVFDELLISIRMKGKRVEVQLIHVPINMYYMKNSLTIMTKTSLQNSIDGLCGSFRIKQANENKKVGSLEDGARQ